MKATNKASIKNKYSKNESVPTDDMLSFLWYDLRIPMKGGQGL